MPWFEDEAKATAKTERQGARALILIAAASTLIHLCIVFAVTEPENPYFCGLPGTLLGLLWLVVGGQASYSATWGKWRLENRRWLLIAGAISLLAGSYLLIRADFDVFTLSVRWHLSRMGDTDQIRREASGWVQQRRAESEGVQPEGLRIYAFYRDVESDDGRLRTVRVVDEELPPALREVRRIMPRSRGRISDDSLRLEAGGIYLADLQICFPDSKPQMEWTLWDHVRGTKREVAPGITLRIYKSSK